MLFLIKYITLHQRQHENRINIDEKSHGHANYTKPSVMNQLHFLFELETVIWMYNDQNRSFDYHIS